jgi:uncharacterized protein with FMN-binding domain
MRKSNFLLSFIVLTVTLLWSQSGLTTSEHQQLIETAERFTDGTDYSIIVAEKIPVVKFHNKDKEINYFVQSTDFSQIKGYNGITNLALVFNLCKQLVSVQIIKSEDTRLYIRKIISAGFLELFIGKSEFENINPVSGATISSRAIICAIEEICTQIEFD